MDEEYAPWFHEALERNRVLYHEARKLGDDAKVKEFADELHSLFFINYERTCFMIREFQKATQEHPELTPTLKETLPRLIRWRNEQAERLEQTADMIMQEFA